MFLERNGADNSLNKILIIFTDGNQTPRRSAEDPALIAEELRQSGVNVLIVGVGAFVNAEKLLRIGGGHANKVFYADTYEGLIKKGSVNNIMNENCIFVGMYHVLSSFV